MSFTVRDLYAVVGMSRPDLPQATYGVALQAAVRRICQQTMLARTTLEFDVLADTNSVDLAVSNGSVLMAHHVLWKADTDTDWTPLAPVSFDAAFTNQMWEETGSVPYSYSQQGNALLFYGVASVDGTLRVTISYYPTNEIDTAPLPGWARPAVEAAAEALLLNVPGPGKDSRLSAQRERDVKGMVQDLKAKSLFGESGEVAAYVPINPYNV